jgi:vacuolar-type H+-ATPase subunit E/Vma4
MVRAEQVSEAVAALAREVSTLDERLTNVRRDIDGFASKGQKSDDTVNAIERKLAVIEERLNELKRGLEIVGNRTWAVLPSAIGGVIGASVALAGQFLLRKLFP